MRCFVLRFVSAFISRPQCYGTSVLCLLLRRTCECAFRSHFASIAEFGRIADIFCVNTYQIITFAFVLLCALIGTVHFLRNSSKDKIRTRMIFEMFITVDIATVVFIILQPQHFDILIRIAIVNTSPLIGHFISLTNTKLTNITCIVLMIIALSIPIVTYFLGLWTPSLTF